MLQWRVACVAADSSRNSASLEYTRFCGSSGLCFCRQMHDYVQSMFTARSGCSLSPFPFLSFCLFYFVSGLSDPVTITSFFSCSSGCSPGSAPCSGAAHAGSVVNSDPPCSFPPSRVCSAHQFHHAFIKPSFSSRCHRAPLQFSCSSRNSRVLLSPSRSPLCLLSSHSSRFLLSSSCLCSS